MKRATLVGIETTGGAGQVNLSAIAGLVSSCRWTYRALFSLGDPAGVVPGALPQNFWVSFDAPPAAGPPAVGVAVPNDGTQVEVPIHSPGVPSVVFWQGAFAGVINMILEWDDGTPPPVYQRGGA